MILGSIFFFLDFDLVLSFLSYSISGWIYGSSEFFIDYFIVVSFGFELLIVNFETDDEVNVFFDVLYVDVVALKFDPVLSFILSACIATVDLLIYLLTILSIDLLLLIDLLPDDIYGSTVTCLFVTGDYSIGFTVVCFYVILLRDLSKVLVLCDLFNLLSCLSVEVIFNVDNFLLV